MASSPTRRSRIMGALLAHHAGDALGATLEFQTHAQIASQYPEGLRHIIGGGHFGWSPGHATDDTDMTRAALLAYRDHLNGPHPGDGDVATRAGEYFLDWLQGQWPGRTPGSSPADIGCATTVGLRRFADTRDPDCSGAREGSAGNGSLMRCLPTGLFQHDREKLIAESVRISKVTHTDARCTVSCAAYNAIASELIKGASVDTAIRAGEDVAAKLEGAVEGAVHRAIRKGREVQIVTMAQRGPPLEMKTKCSGYVLETLTLAVSSLLDDRSLEDVLVDVVRIGRDTDTNAAVAGGLLGARDGVEAIPEHWRQVLQFGDEFSGIVASLLDGEASS